MIEWLFGEEKKPIKKITEGFEVFSEEIRSDYFNCLIFGKTKSGKTYFLLNVLYPAIRDLYTHVYIFSRETNKNEYKKAIPNCIFVSAHHVDILREIFAVQSSKGKEINGTTVYDARILIIWDDYLDEKAFKDPDFKAQFFNGRHYQISVVMLTQVSNGVLKTEIKNNTQISVFFKMVDPYQLVTGRKRIEECIVNEGYDQKQACRMSGRILNDLVIRKKYGCVIINDAAEMLYPKINVDLYKPKKRKLELEESSESEGEDDESPTTNKSEQVDKISKIDS
jgi:hypothetical protein